MKVDSKQKNAYDLLIEENEKLKHYNKQMNDFLKDLSEDIKDFTLNFLKYDKMVDAFLSEAMTKVECISSQLSKINRFLD